MERLRGLTDLGEQTWTAQRKWEKKMKGLWEKGLPMMELYFDSIQEQLTEQKKMVGKFLKRAESVLKMAELEQKAKQ